MLLNPIMVHVPASLEEAVKLYSSLENVRLQAGGTFLLNSLKQLKRKGTKTPDHVISLHKVPELKGVTVSSDKLIIQAMTTINELMESACLKNNFSVFKTVCKNISTNPIRNMATVGGNLTCRYTWTEMPAVMTGMDATMHFIDKEGKDQALLAEEFFKQGAKSDKIFTHVTLPRDTQASIAYRRIKKTQFVDIPLLSLLINTNIKNGRFTNTRVSVNNCVAFAQRDAQLEDFLNKNKIGPKLPEQALDHLNKDIYDTRSSDYKKHMFRVCIKSAVQEILDKSK